MSSLKISQPIRKDYKEIVRLKNEQTVWISSLYVRVDLQGKGYGSKLLKKIENFAFKNMAKVVVLETEKEAKWAVSFYLKNGYKKITKNILAKFPFDRVLEKPPVPNRYILGKVVRYDIIRPCNPIS